MAARAGRARDASIDERVLSVAARHLARYGYEAMSLAAIAEEAGTTRQALYRRWRGKAELAAAIVATMSDTGAATTSDDPFSALVAELSDFQRGVSRPGRLSLVGTMLQDTTERDVRSRYRAEVIAPRRRRLRSILDRAAQLGMVGPDADLEVAVTMGTGSWYARELAGERVPADWPRRAAALVWRAVGGQPPPLPPARSRLRRSS